MSTFEDTLRLWDLTVRQPVPHALGIGEARGELTYEVMPDGVHYLVESYESANRGQKDIWRNDGSFGECVAAVDANDVAQVFFVSATSGRTLLLSRTQKGTLLLRDLDAEKNLLEKDLGEGTPPAATITVDAALIALAFEDGTFRLIEVDADREIDMVSAHSFSMDFGEVGDKKVERVRTILSAQGANNIRGSAGWRIAKAKASVAVNAGRPAVVLGDFVLSVIDLKANSTLARFNADAPFDDCALSADGAHIIALDSTRRLHVFEIVGTARRRPLHSMQGS